MTPDTNFVPQQFNTIEKKQGIVRLYQLFCFHLIGEFLSSNENIFTSKKNYGEILLVIYVALISHQEHLEHIAEIRTAVDIPPYEDG